MKEVSCKAALASLLAPAAASGGPSGAEIVHGQVNLTSPDPGALVIDQQSDAAIINWQSFSIGANEYVVFNQPSASAAVLNRVIGQLPSEILGDLTANGRVFLINPQGIVIGSGARIDTNSFVASTLDIADADFLAGRLRFMAGAHSLDWWAMLDEALVQGSSGRVAAASFGLCGDLGTTSSLPFLLPRPESFARIVGDERGYVAARETRLGVRSVAQPVLGRGHGWIPACVGFDGGLQAPFVPVARGQGAIFGVTSRLTVGARLARLPHAMLHRCIRPATATDDAVHMPIGRMLHAILSRLGRVSGADAATRMRELGRRLGELASLSAGTRRDFLEELADARCFAVRQAMMLRIESRGRRAPRWAADAAGFLQRLRRGRDAQDRDVPIELRGLGPDRGRKAFWEHLERFSRVLAVWPDVWESCRQARRRERARSKIAAGE